MSQISDEYSTLVNWFDALPIYGEIGVCVIFSTLLFVFVKYVLLKNLGKFVEKTDVGWDNDLFTPLSNRILVFSVVISINISLAWISPDALVVLIHPMNAAYIVILTSMITSTIKVITPPFFTWISSDNSGVAVAGRNNFVSGFGRIIIWLYCISLVLTEFQLEISGILASLAVFSIIIGLALQHTIGNILNSFLLAMDRPFDVGDRIQVDGIEGKVVSTGILSTKILTWSEELVIIPNNTLVSSTICNMARGGGDGIPKRINLLVDISVAYDEEIPHVKQVLIDIAKTSPYSLNSPKPRVLVIKLNEYSIDFRIYTWIADYADQWPARDWMLQHVADRFRDEGITIPYPVNIELKTQQKGAGSGRELTTRRKIARQHTARLQMSRADEIHREERETVQSEIAWLEKQLIDKSLSMREKDKIRSEIGSLASTLDIFDGE